MNIIKKTIKNIIKLNNPIIITFLVLIIILTSKYLKKNYYKSRKINILVLNLDRFHEDVEILNENSEFNFIIFNQKIFYYFAAPFIDEIRTKLKKQKWWEIQETPEYRIFISKYSSFLTKFLKIYFYFNKIHLIITPSFYYFQDTCWDIAAKNLKIPFFCFFKESTRDKFNLENSTKLYKKKKYKFNGDIIVVYSIFAKNILIKSNITKLSKIRVIGSPRFDNLFGNKKKYNREIITLFSFRHQIGDYEMTEGKNTSGFSNDNEGAVNYFFNVHNTICLAAYNNPNKIFYIKTKFKKGWHDRIYKIIDQFEKNHNVKLNNIIVDDKINPHNLILKSKLVIGINSTTLIESRVLNTDVVIPIFDEMSKKMSKYIYFKDYFDEFILAYSKESLLQLINQYLINDYSYNKIKDLDMLKNYLGTTTGDNTNKYIKLINEYIKQN